MKASLREQGWKSEGVIFLKTEREHNINIKSDKSNKLTLDSVENYSEALSVHHSGDTKVDLDQVKSIEKEMNRTLKHFNKIFCVGAARPPDRRLAEASTSTNVLPPPLYGMRKDHKVVQPGQGGSELHSELILHQNSQRLCCGPVLGV